MSNYTNRPTETFCTEVNEHTFELIKAWAKENGVIASNRIVHDGFNRECRFIYWQGRELWVVDGVRFCFLPLSDFIAKFKTPTETDAQKRERLIEELQKKLDNTSVAMVNFNYIYELCNDVKVIKSLKPKS